MVRRQDDNSNTNSSDSIQKTKTTLKQRKHRNDESSLGSKLKSQRKVSKTRKYKDDDSSTDDKHKSQRKHKSYTSKRSRRDDESSESSYVSKKDLEKLKRDRKVRELHKRIDDLELELSDQKYKYNKLKSQIRNSDKENTHIKTSLQTTKQVVNEETPKTVIKQPELDSKYTNNEDKTKKGAYKDTCCLDFK